MRFKRETTVIYVIWWQYRKVESDAMRLWTSQQYRKTDNIAMTRLTGRRNVYCTVRRAPERSMERWTANKRSVPASSIECKPSMAHDIMSFDIMGYLDGQRYCGNKRQCSGRPPVWRIVNVSKRSNIEQYSVPNCSHAWMYTNNINKPTDVFSEFSKWLKNMKTFVAIKDKRSSKFICWVYLEKLYR